MKDKKNLHEDTRFSSSEHGKRVIKNFRQQLRVANRTEQTVKNYSRSIEGLMNFLDELPEKRGKLLCRDVILLVYGKDITICPTCKQGVLLTYGHWTKNKEPPA
jgi:3-deoxy-D-arabino-heptulosonate 7-phosphate (DAHP) synthase